MPELSRSQRMAGARVAAGVKLERPRRLYTDADCRRCIVCRHPIPRALTTAGIKSHPTCYRGGDRSQWD